MQSRTNHVAEQSMDFYDGIGPAVESLSVYLLNLYSAPTR